MKPLPPHMRPTFNEDEALVVALRLLYTDATETTLCAELHVGRGAVNRAARRWATSEELRSAAIRKMVASRARPGYTRRPRAPRFDFSRVNWAMPDAAIARQLGSSQTLVGRQRKESGKPASPHYRCQERTVRIFGVTEGARARREAEIVRRLLDTADTCHTIGAELGISTATVHGILRRHTTQEQRRAMRAKKIAASKLNSPGGFVLNHVRKAIRAEASGGRVARLRECESCGASVPGRATRCSKCGSSAVAFFGQAVPVTKREAPKPPASTTDRAKQNVRRFLAGLEVA